MGRTRDQARTSPRRPHSSALSLHGLQAAAYPHQCGPGEQIAGQASSGRRSYPEVLRLPAEPATVAQLLDNPAFIDRGADTLGGTGTPSSSPPEVLTATP
jgi:hypothetical protein